MVSRWIVRKPIFRVRTPHYVSGFSQSHLVNYVSRDINPDLLRHRRCFDRNTSRVSGRLSRAEYIVHLCGVGESFTVRFWWVPSFDERLKPFNRCLYGLLNYARCPTCSCLSSVSLVMYVRVGTQLVITLWTAGTAGLLWTENIVMHVLVIWVWLLLPKLITNIIMIFYCKIWNVLNV